MKTADLVIYTDENGTLGWGLTDMPHDDTTNSGDGLQIAHDLLEHVNGPGLIGTIHDELEALGAIWYVRGQHGELRRDGAGSRYSIAENVASDVVRMFCEHYHGADMVYDDKRTRAVEHDDELGETLAAADAMWRAELDSPGNANAATHWQRYRKEALARMRTGYRKARARYEARGRYAANNLFWGIVQAIADAGETYEGQRFTLRYGFDAQGNASATLTEATEEY